MEWERRDNGNINLDFIIVNNASRCSPANLLVNAFVSVVYFLEDSRPSRQMYAPESKRAGVV